MHKDRWFKFYPAEFLDGVMELTMAERGLYVSLLCYMYDHGGPVSASPARLARRLGCERRTVSRVLDKLIALGKITQTGDLIFNQRVKSQLNDREITGKKRAIAAQQGAKKRNKNNDRGEQLQSNSMSTRARHKSLDSSIIIKDNNNTTIPKKEEWDFQTNRERDAEMRPHRLRGYALYELWLPEWGKRPESPEVAANILKEEYGIDVD